MSKKRKKEIQSSLLFKRNEEDVGCLDKEETDQSLMSDNKEKVDGNEEEEENDFIPNYYCNICKTLKMDKPYHCQSCDVCIDGYDHHCPWIGKVKKY